MSVFSKVSKGLQILKERLSRQGPRVTALWAADHVVRAITGANIRSVSQVAPQLHVGGQYRRRGWPRLASRGITAVVNMRIEFDDKAAGIAPPRYLHLPTVDDSAPTLEQLERGVAFIADELARGGGVLVHCGAGVGRAATMAVAYLVRTGRTPSQAWEQVRTVRPFIRPSQEQVDLIERFVAPQQR